MKRKIYNTVLLFIASTFYVFAQGGMWLPNTIKGNIEKDMQRLGMKLTADDIYNTGKSSIKDAIVQFGGGCTGEVISPKGLVLTNHHCGYGAIQRLSSMENNLLKNGYWAQSLKEELPAKGLTVTFVDKITDVTSEVLGNISDQLSLQERQSLIDKNIDSLKNNTPKEDYQTIELKPFYYGNKYYLFIKTIYKDIRLVGVAPESIGKFGADTDNWMWPRHNADFSIFRIYAGKDNLPAEYSEENVPFSPKHF
ncbi:MAG TPA: serine protease, partial [Saprospiraceae bacterium]|nr:serine protease [Saprospiraceae bacterium]